MPHWRDRRLAAADDSTIRFAIRASHVPRAADADPMVFGLYLLGAELMLLASVRSTHANERQMLFEQIVALAPPSPRDVADYECPATPIKVRGVRHVASAGRVRVLMTTAL
ncbi:hypothetical protein [Dyella sp. M7H15-1]|uniref:hypothetical protein n=1 Tax=Dyella sp. M7H15-1 TaxID=2501295 RepID=UPI00197ACD27|nr:hypothetical protein [Dyella sp. M7H15-1]